MSGETDNRLRDALAEDLIPAPNPPAAPGAARIEPGDAPMPGAGLPSGREHDLARKLEGAFLDPSPAPVPPGHEPALPRGPQLPSGATLAGAVEALLFIANEPLSSRELSDLLDKAPIPDVRAAVQELRDRYAREPRGFDLVEIAGGFRLLTRPEYARWVERLETVRREERLSRAQLETLAVIAYRQPVLRADVDSMRGADSGGAMRGLVEKGLVKVVGRAEAVGRPLLYGTTDRFLERFGLKSLRELPRSREDANAPPES